MVSSRRRRRKRVSGSNLPAIAIGGCSLIIVGTLGAWSFLTPDLTLDEETLCLTGQEHPTVVTILVDSTDTIPSRASAKALSLISSKIDDLDPNSLINLYEINTSASEFTSPVLSICKPDSGANASQLTQAPALMQKRFEERFYQPLKNTLSTLMQKEPSTLSPIIEAIDSALTGSVIANRDSKHLFIVVSDLIQNSTFLSFYKAKPSYQAFDSLVRETGAASINFSGATASLLVVPREPPLGSRSDLVGFWGDFLKSQSAGIGSTLEPL
jgi:hypothetical protein